MTLSPPLSFLLQEKRIYELKKKNQELEKFKFVLDYKIKELKKQIEPRENEIKVMKEQIQEVSSHQPRPGLQDIAACRNGCWKDSLEIWPVLGPGGWAGPLAWGAPVGNCS